MKGAVYRLAVRIKEAGERLRISSLIRLGLRLREWAIR
jgi:hypothetical protein